MPILIGAGIAIAMGLFARLTGFDRDRAFYSTVLIIVGSYYVLFAAVAGDGQPLVVETAIFMLFVVTAVLGFRLSLWIIVAGLAAHGLFDLLRGPGFPGNGAPQWWPGFCMGFDVVAAIWLAGLIALRPVHKHRHHHQPHDGAR